MTPRERRTARKRWRRQKRIEREKARALKEILTPPTTPEAVNHQEPSRQKIQSTKKQRREMAKCYRDNDHLKKQLAKQILIAKKYKRRLENTNDKLKKTES